MRNSLHKKCIFTQKYLYINMANIIFVYLKILSSMKELIENNAKTAKPSVASITMAFTKNTA